MELEDRPNYNLMEKLLREYLNNNNIQEHPYDWEAGGRNKDQGRAPADRGDAHGRAGGGKREWGVQLRARAELDHKLFTLYVYLNS